MKKAVALLSVLFCINCGKPPDLVIDNMEVFYNGQSRIDEQLEIALPIIKSEAISKAKSCNKENDLLSRWNIVIEFKDNPLKCGPVKAAGCQDAYNLGTFYIGWKPKITDTVLVGEIGHLVWEVCYNKTGENDSWVNGKPVQTLDSDYQDWFERVNQEIKNDQEKLYQSSKNCKFLFSCSRKSP